PQAMRRGRRLPSPMIRAPAPTSARLVALRRPRLFLDPRGLAGEVAQVVDARPAHLALAHHLHLLQPRRVQVECPLDADAVRDAPDGEVRAGAATVPADDHPLEHLRALALPLDDLR